MVGAVEHADALVAEALPGARRVIDLGCGVGGSACRWALGDPGRSAVGLTLSPAQVAIASERAEVLGLSERVRFVCGDYTAPPALGPFDGAFAIESFVHGPDPAAFFAGAASLLRPGGRLVLIDDFLSGPEEALPAEAARRIAELRAGWRMGSLVPSAAIPALAAGFALVDDRDLTPLLRLWRPRDHLVSAWVALTGRLGRHHPYQQSLIGGNALQHALSRGWVRYRRLVLERAPDPGTLGP